MRGSDGNDYVFLLKGHEDLRQDERVMVRQCKMKGLLISLLAHGGQQLFGLVNALLRRDPHTSKDGLLIQRYAIAPLSHNCGVVGWVPNSDTMHSLINEYRVSKKILLSMEAREMQKITQDYEQLPLMGKVEVFTEALRKTTGNGSDLYEIVSARADLSHCHLT
jgi:serine/threonine-protein kinase mTOR